MSDNIKALYCFVKYESLTPCFQVVFSVHIGYMKIKICRSVLPFFIGVLFMMPVSAEACSCRGAIDITSHFIRAQYVVIAEVTDTKLVKTIHKEHDLEYIVADIKTIEALKKPEGASVLGKVMDLVPENGNCSIGLISGMEYVFFVDSCHHEDEESETGWIKPDNYVGRCTGSHRINFYSIKFDKEHMKLRELAKRHKQGELEWELSGDSDKDTFMSDSFRLND